jgi:hypothetical protein
MDRSVRNRLAARPACPAPTTTVVTRSMSAASYATSTVTFTGLVMMS